MYGKFCVNRKSRILNFKDFPDEEEVILCPGSVFQVLDCQGAPDNKVVEIRLKLIADVNELKHQGRIMVGAMQSEMSTDKIAKLIALESLNFHGCAKLTNQAIIILCSEEISECPNPWIKIKKIHFVT